MSEITWTAERGAAIIEEIETVIVGKRQSVETVVIGLLCSGHILIEDIPGVGKTMLAKALAGALGATYRRVQFTPDLLPADVTGTSVFNQKTGEFAFRQGPVFTNILLADEINRATPKTQSSLLECMEEFQVTVDGATHVLDRPFFVIATENPIEYRGTYPLPEAQLDRFLMRVNIGYPTAEEEVVVLDRQVKEHPIKSVKAVVAREEVLRMQESVKDVHIEPVYNVGEKSGIKIYKVIFSISWLLLRLFFWRIKEKYVVRDFHPLVFFYMLGIFLSGLNLVFFVRLIVLWIKVGTAPQLTAIAWMFTFVGGLQSLFFAMWFDKENNRQS